MENFIYCIENSQLSVGECRNVYIKLEKRLSSVQWESLKLLLVKTRTKYKNSLETTHYDIVYEALEEFYIHWGFGGVIIDIVEATLIY